MTERELDRQARHRLAVLRHVEEVSGNVSATCRYYGISRNCFYKWQRRYEAEGLDGLKDRSSKPPGWELDAACPRDDLRQRPARTGHSIGVL
jgi:transposase-like protein